MYACKCQSAQYHVLEVVLVEKEEDEEVEEVAVEEEEGAGTSIRALILSAMASATS